MPKKRRRGNGEGSIFQTKDSLWRGFVTIGYTEEGKQLKRWISDRTQQGVLEKLNAVRHLSSSRIIEESQTFTVAEWLTRFTDFRAKGVRPKTRECHRYYVAKINVSLGSKRLNHLSRSHVRRFYAQLVDDGLGISVRRHIHHYLKAALDEAFQERLIDRNPACVDVPKGQPSRKGETWEPEQVDKFLEVARADRLYPLFHLLLFQGVRIGEVLAFMWEDYDGQRLTVKQTLGYAGGRLMLGPPKTERGYRVFYLLPRTNEVLETHRCNSTGLFIFTNDAGGLLDPNNVRRSYRRLVKQAGLPYIRLHDHRHTFITLGRRAGVAPEVLAAIVGHDPAVMNRVYTHVSDKQRKEAAKKLADYFSGPCDDLDEAA